MRKQILAAAAAIALSGGAAHATGVLDPTGDFLSTFIGIQDPTVDPAIFGDLDITSFSVRFDSGSKDFKIHATFADDIDPTKAGLYVLGVNTGGATNHPFDNIGEPNVIFNKAFAIQKTGAVNGQSFTASIQGASLSLAVPLSALPSATGLRPDRYTFNFWARSALGNNNQNADFAPENAVISAAPEPSAWAMMLLGFGGLGATLRLRRKSGEAIAA